MKMRKIVAAVLVLLLLCFAAAGQAASLKDVLKFLQAGDPVSFRIQVEAGKLPQFGEKRTGQLNLLLKHLEITGAVEAQESAAAFLLDGKRLFTAIEWTEPDGRRISALDTGTGKQYILSSEKSDDTASTGIDALLRNRDIFLSLDAYAAFFRELPNAFPDKAGTVKVGEKYRDYGNAVRKVNLVLNAEDLTGYITGNAAKYGKLYPDPAGFVFEGKQSFSLYFTAEDVLIRITYSGRCGTGSDDLRSVRLEWKTLRSEKADRDEIVLRTPNSQGTKRNNFLLKHVRKAGEDGAETFSWDTEIDRVAGGVRTRLFSAASLDMKDCRLNGTLTERISSQGRESTAEARPDFTVQEDGRYSGTLEIIHKKDKIETDRWSFAAELAPKDPSQAAEEAADTVTLSEDGAADLIRRISAEIVRSLLSLPSEDLLFLADGLPEGVLEEIAGLIK